MPKQGKAQQVQSVTISDTTPVYSTNVPWTLPKTFKTPFTGKISILTVFFVQINVKEYDIYEFV